MDRSLEMHPAKRHILIIGSDSLLLSLLADVLCHERQGVGVTCRSDLAQPDLEGWSNLTDLMIVDGSMSGQEGLELIARVQAVYPHIPAILITAADSDEMRERRRQYRASFVLFTKPFSIDLFLAQVEDALDKSTVGRQERVRSQHPAFLPALTWA
jgi:DNA-binding NtrC family response regulator